MEIKGFFEVPVPVSEYELSLIEDEEHPVGYFAEKAGQLNAVRRKIVQSARAAYLVDGTSYYKKMYPVDKGRQYFIEFFGDFDKIKTYKI